jgi:hypothetical protein
MTVRGFKLRRDQMKIQYSFKLLSVSILMLALAGLANAQATRTWVSGVGDDANPCSRTAPCKTFAGAISKTAAGGEISVLDPGGFGAVTITKAITIDGGGGIVASVLSSASAFGIQVNAGVNDVVTLRNLRINGAGTGVDGIRYIQGAALHVENCDLNGFTNLGINVNLGSTGKLTVENTNITEAAVAGISLATTAGSISADIHAVRISNGAVGLKGQGGSFATVRDCDISFMTTAGVQQVGASLVTVATSSIASSGTALQSAAGSLILASGNIFVLNSVIFAEGGGSIFTTSDNVNSSNGTVGANHGAIGKV